MRIIPRKRLLAIAVCAENPFVKNAGDRHPATVSFAVDVLHCQPLMLPQTVKMSDKRHMRRKNLRRPRKVKNPMWQ